MQKHMADPSLSLHLEAILAREFQRGKNRIHITGTASPALTALLLSHACSSNVNNLPHIVVVDSFAEAERLQKSIRFFDSHGNALVLRTFDVSPYSGLDPNRKYIMERLRFLFAAQNALPGQIFIAPIQALMQLTLPYTVLRKFSSTIKTGDDVPANLSQFLNELGYEATPYVEDMGQYSIRGGIIDIFSPAHQHPIRIELFGDSVESLRFFSVLDQKSISETSLFHLIPCRESLFTDDNLEDVVLSFRKSIENRQVDKDAADELLRSITRKINTPEDHFLLPFFYKSLVSPLDHFSSSANVWLLDPLAIAQAGDEYTAELKKDFTGATRQLIAPPVEKLFCSPDLIQWPIDSRFIEFSSLNTENFLTEDGASERIPFPTYNLNDLCLSLTSHLAGSENWNQVLNSKLAQWKKENYRIFIGVRHQSQAERLRLLFDKLDYKITVLDENFSLADSCEEQNKNNKLIHLCLREINESLRIPEDRLIFIRVEDLLGQKQNLRQNKASDEFQSKAKRLSFGDLKPGDCVVHTLHGVGVYEGLKVMGIGGADSEFIQIAYKDKDKLYLPVYRVGQLQRYAGATQTTVLDKLGGTAWEKTKTKVRSHLRDIAADLLKIYAKRSELHRPGFKLDEKEFLAFENAFPYDETDDQLRAINDLIKDMTSDKPMDRLICGDVGFGKTEVAMRAAFLCAHNRRQVAVLAPTTVLSFQHFETFKKRFKDWPFEIRELNRFVSAADVKKTLAELKAGKVDIIIGTHRILSKDIEFQNLGLMIVDEEQKFGVLHKEKIKKLKTEIDTLTLSATPIPRTLNMSLMGIRDLSIINSAPVDRLPTRTFICKFDGETIRKAIESEINRGGQIYFIHNRVQSIYGVADEIKQLVPSARMRVAHGQMNEDELEKTMVAFFNHEIDVLVCTAIVESGMDVSRANTMFIDQSHMMGLSQLYQLRGRVGRSKQRAYCYLILPRTGKIEKDAQERLKVIQENTALGSGIRIAQYDLELRGSGNLLGEEQSGHVNAVGYEMYMDLLNEAVQDLRGDGSRTEAIDPEINLRIPAMIPDNYINDIRVRLSYYKALAEIQSHEDLQNIEEELKDQFGPIPDPTLNLMGLMLIRSQCRQLGVLDVSAGPKNLSLKFSPNTKLKTETVISLAVRENKKYSITPDNRLNIRMNQIQWPAVFEEIAYLLRLAN